MKIVCDSCSAKYSIADEKVAGKVFKIRCKKCSAVIVVRGDQINEPAPQEQESTSVYDQSADAVWHVVVAGDQQGPFAPQQLGEMLTAGTIDWEAYVWCEGFEGWLAARDVPELVEAITGQGAQDQAAAQEPAGAVGAADPFAAAQPDAAASPFAGGAADAAGYGQEQAGYGQEQAGHGQEQAGYGQEQAAAYGQDQADAYGQDQAAAGYGAEEGGGLFAGAADPGFGAASEASHAHADAGADLFGQSSGSPFEGGGADEDVVASADPRISADQAMTGQRNENSVLFSLANLQALATGSGGGAPTPSAAAPSPAASSSRAGHASGEGSGLIDIRALAGAGVADSGPSMGAAGAKSNVDDLLSIGTGSPLGSSLGAPVLAPVQEEKSNKGMLIGLVAAAGILAAAAIVVVVILVTKEPEPVAQASGAPGAGEVAGTPGVPGTGGSAEGTPSAGDGEPATATGDDPEGGGDTAGEGDDEGGSEEPEGRTGGRRRTPRTGGMAASGMTTAPSQMSTPDPLATTRMSGRSGSIDDLLDMALNPGSMMASAPSMTAMSGSSLPATPPRDAVARALRSVAGAVSACGQGQHGVATTAVTVSGSTGRVTSARVTGQFAGTPVGSCVARAVRGARFPRFGNPSMTVNFPYRI